MSKQPYNFAQGNPAGSLAQKIGGFIAGGLQQRSGVHQAMMEHEMRIRENLIDTAAQITAVKAQIKAQGKADRKLTKTTAKAKAKGNIRSAEGMAQTAKTLSRSAAPGTKLAVTPERVEFTKPPAKKPAPKPPVAEAPVTPARTPKKIARPSMRRGTY